MWLETMDSMQLTHASGQPDPTAESHDIRPGRLLYFLRSTIRARRSYLKER